MHRDSAYSPKQTRRRLMIRSGDEYRASIRDGREVWMNGERITDVTDHPAFKPLVDARARIYDMAHDPATSDLMSYQDVDNGERHAVGLKLPHTREDWEQKRRAVDAVMDDLGGVVIRVGDETVGEMWSLYDGQDVLNEVDPQFSANIERHIQQVLHGDPFHVSANTDPSARRTRTPTCCCTSSARPTTASSCAEPSTRPQPPMPTRRSSNRRSPTGATASCPTTRSASSATWARPASSTSAAPGSPAAHRPRTTRWPTASTRWTRSSSSTTSRSPGRTCCSTGIRVRPPSSGRLCIATAPFRSCSGSSGSRTC